MTKDSFISHGRLAFFAQPQRFYLPLLVGLHGYVTKVGHICEEKMFWKVTSPSAPILFLQKILGRLTSLFYLYLSYLHLKPREKCGFFSDGGSRDRDMIQYSEIERILYFVRLHGFMRLCLFHLGQPSLPFPVSLFPRSSLFLLAILPRPPLSCFSM